MCSRCGSHGSWLGNTVGITDPDKPFYSLRHSGITDLRVARIANGEIAVKPDIERYITAHGKKDEHGGYGEYSARELKAAIEWVRKSPSPQGSGRGGGMSSNPSLAAARNSVKPSRSAIV